MSLEKSKMGKENKESRKIKNTKVLERIFRNLPIVTRVTLWYTFFIIIIFTIITGSVLFLGEKIALESSKGVLTKEVNKVVENPDKFRGFNDGIFFSVYNYQGVHEGGRIPSNFDKFTTLKDGEAGILKANNTEYIYYDKKIEGSQGGWIRGIIPIDKARRELQVLIWIFIIASPIAVILVVYGGYKIVKNGFKPVREISNTALDIKENKDFSKRINLMEGRDELHEIAHTFNSMLDSLENSYMQEKEFSTNVSHELRTPTAVILSESQFALENGDTMEEMKESMEVIARHSKRMKNLINQIMELSKLETMNTVKKEKLDMSNLLDKVIKDYENLAKKENINFTYKIDDNIFASADKTMIIRLVDNLVGNALKFTKDRIDIKVKDKGEKFIFIVLDNGIGMEKEDLDKIWNRFYQSNESRNKEENAGNGLGLSLVKKIVDLHNGTIEVESQIGKGSQFTVQISK